MRMRYCLPIIIIFVLLTACGKKTNRQNENLPVGMKSGYWSDNEINGFVFFANGYFTNDGGEALGTYTLIDNDTILLEWLVDWTEELDIIVAESGDQIIVSHSGIDDTVFDLVIPDTSSGSLKKEIVGTWEAYGDLSFLQEEASSSLWEFQGNGNLILTKTNHSEVDEVTTVPYEFTGEQIIVNLDGVKRTLTIMSLGDLIYLADIDNYTINLDDYMWVFLVRQ